MLRWAVTSCGLFLPLTWLRGFFLAAGLTAFSWPWEQVWLNALLILLGEGSSIVLLSSRDLFSY
jgi:hypothetical protein